jgi:hypothetical protein
MALQGMFTYSEEANAIYRNKDLMPLEKFFLIGERFFMGILNAPEFHSEYGPEIDTALRQLNKELTFYFNES